MVTALGRLLAAASLFRETLPTFVLKVLLRLIEAADRLGGLLVKVALSSSVRGCHESRFPSVLASQSPFGGPFPQMVELLCMPRGESEAMLRPNTSAKALYSVNSLELDLRSPATHVKRDSRGSLEFPRRRLSFSCSKFAMDKAAQGGHMGVLQLLHYQVDWQLGGRAIP